MRRILIETVRDRIQGEFWNSKGKDFLEHFLYIGATVIVCAGGIRDTLMSEEFGFDSIEPRDWDIAIAGISRAHFRGVLKEVGGSINKYRGFKLFGDSAQPWEIWRQEDTTGLRKVGAPRTIENMLRSFVLDCNAVGFDLDTGHTLDSGALRSIATLQVSVLENALQHDESVFAAKALILSLRRPLKLNAGALAMVKKHLDIHHLMHELNKVYPTTIDALISGGLSDQCLKST